MKRDIAIIGMAGRFPKSEDIQAFWNNLVEEKELVHFFDDDELLARGVAKKDLDHPNLVKVASMISHPERFDYPFFKYTLDEAMVMNPQTRVMHQLVWHALEDAGCNIDTYHKKIGIFTGANKDLNWSLYSALVENENVDELTKSKLINPNFMASLIAFKLNFTGPCYFIDTACSTSLSTAHLACRSLLLNECGIAVVGGIRLISYLDNGYHFVEGSIMSKDGHSRSFDQDSSGTIPCDGAGVVILKKLEEAIKDRDQIYAVIKASAMNNDGNRKAGYTMPSVQGQTDCIKLAQKIAGVQAHEIAYVETHGTGTKIGDPIEIEALNIAFNQDTTHRCAIGTVKSNMGHADEAAGIAGLIKTALILRHQQIPASLHFRQANPTIPFDQGPFYVNAQSVEWTTNTDQLRSAAVSSLGIGGTNVHMILQEAKPLEEHANSINHHLIRYSAKSPTALEAYKQKLLTFLQKEENIDFARLACTLQTGRKSFPYGQFLVADSAKNLLDQLLNKTPQWQQRSEKEQIVFMFSGQGSQYAKMGKGIYDKHPFFSAIMDRGFALLQEQEGVDYQSIWLDENSDLINETQYTQPILFVFEYALARFFIELGIQPDYMIGHSLGEYVAACLSGVFSFEDGIRLIVKRASLMAAMSGGCMLSVGDNYDEINQQLLEGLELAAINSPDSFVLSGTAAAVEKVQNRLREAKVNCRLLKTSHAFHSTLMNGMLADFKTFLQSIELSPPQLPFVSNITGTLIAREQASSADYWVKHIVHPVYFAKGIQQLIQLNHNMFVEIGPGKSLTTFYKQSHDLGKNNAVCYSIRHPKERLADGAHLAKCMGWLWTNGLDIDWTFFYQEKLPSILGIPTYAFDHYDLPTKVSVDEQLKLTGHSPNDSKEEDVHFYLPFWKQQHRQTQEIREVEAMNRYLLFSDGSPFCTQLKEHLTAKGNRLVEVAIASEFKQITKERFQIDPNDLAHYQQLAEALKSLDFDWQQILYAWGLTTKPPRAPITYQSFLQDFNQIRRLLEGFQLWDKEEKKKLLVFHHQSAIVTGAEQNKQLRQSENILLKILSQECPMMMTAVIDVELERMDQRLMHAIEKELEGIVEHRHIAFRNGRRWVPGFEVIYPNPKQMPSLKNKGRYLLVGSLGHIEFILARHLLKNYEAELVFIGPEWSEAGPQFLENDSKEDALLSRERWAELKKGRGQLWSLHCPDFTFDHLTHTVEKVERQFGAIDGLIHAARGKGPGMGTLIENMEDLIIDRHFIPRVNTLLHLQTIFKERKLDFAIVLSSLSAFLGGITYGSYAAANALMDEILLTHQEDQNHWLGLNLDRVADSGGEWIRGRELVQAFEQSFQFAELPQLIISKRSIHQPQRLKQAKPDHSRPKIAIDRSAMNAAFKAAVTETQSELLVLFESLFSMEGIGVEDDFFDLGGDSLKGMMLINKINKNFGIKCAIADIFANPSVLDLSGLIEEKQWLQSDKEMANELVL